MGLLNLDAPVLIAAGASADRRGASDDRLAERTQNALASVLVEVGKNMAICSLLDAPSYSPL